MPLMPTVEELVGDLPEVYQPIYRHPALASKAARSCMDRLAQIREVYALLAARLGRPLRVLDIGCAQGFFSLHLAEAGAEVVGVDILEANVRLCRTLGEEFPRGRVTFRAGGIEDFAPEISPGRFDLFLGLSVFHHLCHAHSFERTKSLVSTLADRIPVGILELALAEEPMPWAQSLPADEMSLLSACPFIRILDRIPTHLSSVKRPLVVASTQYWFFDDRCGKFEKAMTESHEIARGTHGRTRRYFFGDGLLIKQFSLTGTRGDFNRLELMGEAEFLAKPPPGFTPVPKLHAWNIGPHEGWIVRDELPGSLLSEMQAQGKKYDAGHIIRDVLEQLAALEAAGKYHNDVRVWNTLVLESGGATLIDYGAISATPVDCLSQEHPALSFFAYLEAVVSGTIIQNPLLRFSYTFPSRLSEAVGRWVDRIWAHPLEEWSYRLFLNALKAAEAAQGKIPATGPSSLTMVAYLERYLAHYAARLGFASAALNDAAADQSTRMEMVKSQEARITRLTQLVQQHETVSTARNDQNTTLTALVKQHKTESANRYDQITTLTALLKTAQADASNRLTQVNTLTTGLKTSQSDAIARANQITQLTALVKSHETESANRASQIDKLIPLAKSYEADIDALRVQIASYTQWLKDAQKDILALRAAHVDAETTALAALKEIRQLKSP